MTSVAWHVANRWLRVESAKRFLYELPNLALLPKMRGGGALEICAARPKVFATSEHRSDMIAESERTDARADYDRAIQK
ncbi:MAG: hypothetical protein R3C28_09665 [Pirellulaceae bacterium]